MLVQLIGKKSIHKVILPKIVVGNYWICDKTNKKLVNIENSDGNWKIVSNKNVTIIDLNSIKIEGNKISAVNGQEKIEKQIILQEYGMYGIFLNNLKELFILYCSPAYEDNFLHFDIKNTRELRIGRSIENHISYNNNLISEYHARIFLNNGRLMIENFNTDFGTFVNNKPIRKNKALLNGDVIFIMGLKIIIMGNSIYINNPQMQMITKGKNLLLSKQENDIILPDENEEDIEEDLYKEGEYFSRSPRITNLIETAKVKIDAPPQIQDKQEMPAILMLGSTLSMGAMMIVSLIQTIDGSMSGNMDSSSTIFSLITTIVMLIGMMLFPILTMRWEKKQKIKYEEKRQKRYKEYLNSKADEINKIKNKQRNILFKNYASVEECTNIILQKTPRLWERKIEDYDFLSLRLGIGDVPLKIEVQYPEKQFAMEDDDLVEMLDEIGKNSKTLNSAPIVTSLTEKNISAFIVQDKEKFEKFMQNIMVQLVAMQSYEDLKIVFLMDEDKQNKWEYVKMLPHLWDSSREIRFFADDYDDMKELSQYLEEVFRNRVQSDGESYKNFMPYYLIITDDYKKIQNLKIIRNIVKTKINLGFSLLCFTDDLSQLPNECENFISIDNKKGMIFENEISTSNHREITLEVSNTFFFGKIWQSIANIPIRYTSSGRAALPNSYTFLEMFDVGKIEQLNILDRWKAHDSTLSLKAPIGIDENQMPIVLDLHEKFHGPHGLIAGSTGSGKSEFIITYILSLAINYHPDDVTFLLIDYKGGGLAGAFQKNNFKLPHLVGTITNIDTNGLQRSLASIHSEVKRRQIIFNEARNITDEGTIDIYKYQKLYHDGMVSEPIPHLLIICDEFAELKQQQEEFMDELISISRIGRSLGVHLILATQKPAGIVNEQIRSNSKFGVCLKVQEIEDSIDVIKKPDAAFLKNAGQFYMQVGNDDYFILGQSAWSGAPYFPADTTKKKVDNSIEFISNIGTKIKRIDDSKQQVVKNKGEQLTNIVKYICELAKEEHIETNSLWLENIPETIYIDDINKKYKFEPKENEVNVIVGEYDDPYNQSQGPVNLDLSNNGNVVIFGNPESGKETLLGTIVYNLMNSYTTEQLQMYLLDFGSEFMKIFKNSPHVGDVLFMDDNEKLKRFFSMIQNEINKRKTILSDYNGDYKLYLDKNKNSMPMIIVTINNYEAFNEMYEDEYDDTLLSLTREGGKYGIAFILTASSFNDLRYRMSQNFKNKISLQLNKDDDYYNIFEKVGKKRPAHIFGRGLCEIENEVYEFQTAKICNAENYNEHVGQTIERLKMENKVSALPVPTLPKKINIEDIAGKIKNLTAVPIGITNSDLQVFKYNFKKNFMNIIVAKDEDDCIDFCFYVLEVIKQLDDVELIVFNTEKVLQKNLDDFLQNYNDMIYKAENSEKDTLIVIFEIEKLLNNIDEYEFKNSLDQLKADGKSNFIIVENAIKLKNHEFDEWYKDYIVQDTGIWVGDGFDSQYLMNINADRMDINDACGRDFGYVVKKGKFNFIKLLGMKEAGDEDE